MESYSVKKQKISLEDYDYQHDVENRLLISQFSAQDLLVLEEILYSSLTISINKMAKNLDLTQDELLPTLIKLSHTGLFSFDQDNIIVNKEMRKYFEGQLPKFEVDFQPGMEFLQGLLRKVPIHTLPTWYSLPRLSDHIFDSIVEKYLFTPSLFQRYLAELSYSDPLLSSIIKDLYHSPALKLYGKDLVLKYSVSKEELEKIFLLLEFHLVGCLSYEKVGDRYEEILTPFQEWRDYACFLQETDTKSIPKHVPIARFRPDDFSYIHDLSGLLQQAKKAPLILKDAKLGGAQENLDAYLDKLIQKLCQLKLATLTDKRLVALESATDFLEMTTEEKALFLYRHPFNRSPFQQIPIELATDRNLREAEKSILRVLDKGWVYFDEFIKGVIVPLTEQSTICLKKQGKTWKYSLPAYSQDELALINTVVLEWLFEIGITAIGTADGRTCFMVTPFGLSLFGQQ